MGTPRPPANRTTRSRRAAVPLLAVLLCLGAPVLAGCRDTVDSGRKEVHPELEARYDEALRTSLAEVPGGEAAAVVLGHDENGTPVWRSTVVTADGNEQNVRVSATTGDLLAPPSPGGPASARREFLLEKSRLLPEEAARKVTVPDFGKVVRITLGETDGRTVWNVDVATVEEDEVRRSAVDAVTGEVVESAALTGQPGRHEHE